MSERDISRVIGDIVHLLKAFPDENTRLLIINEVTARICTANTGTKVQSSGFAELLACTTLGLVWQKDSIHGKDATDAKGRPVELKTSKRSKAGNVNFNYRIPKRQKGSTLTEHKRQVFRYYQDDKKFEGGHFLVYMNQRKTQVLSWYWIPKEIMAKTVANYAQLHPDSVSMNLGRVPCRSCGHCCWLRHLPALRMMVVGKDKKLSELKCNEG